METDMTKLRTYLAMVVVCATGAAGWAFRPRGHVASATHAVAAPSVSESEIRDRDIEFFEQRVKNDSSGASDRAKLATLYTERARATGANSDYQRAEELARRSLMLRTGHNEQTFSVLASALLARHDFVGALAVAKQVDSLNPGMPSNVALLGEIELELGNYAAADAHFTSLKFGSDQFTIAARVARWHELTGSADAARRLLRGAIQKVAHRTDLPREQVAWFHYRLAELELRTGNLDSADAAFRRGLQVFPDDYRILGGLARLSAARSQWQAAIDYGNRAIAVQLDPATLGTISESYAALGDTAHAAQYARAMTTSALKQPGPIHRAWGLFALDHGTKDDVIRVLAKTRVEMKTRHDIYGYDLLAWALHKQGRDAAAHEAMQHALSQKTEDAQLYYHAGMIERSLGNAELARVYLDRALALNPHFSVTQVRIARAALDSLGGRHV
jgi:tetratricopeptide (TPR) repeat protein